MDKRPIRRYERKVEGFPETARIIVESLQPYHRSPAMLTGPLSHPLWIIHHMDLVDKHRELLITLAAFDVAIGGMSDIWLMFYRYADFPEEETVGLGRAFDPDSKITPQISFREFGGRKIQPVIAGLLKLTRLVHEHSAVVCERMFLKWPLDCRSP